MERKDYSYLFRKLESVQPPEIFIQAVIGRIHKEERHRARRRAILLSACSIASLGTMVPALAYFSSQVAGSGLLDYLSLISTDGVMLAAYWKEFLLALAEALPLFGLTFVLGTLYAFLWSAFKAIRNARTALLPA